MESNRAIPIVFTASLIPATIAFLSLLIPANHSSAAPVKVILDTDISGDVDDCGALALLNTLSDRREAEILACVVNGHDADKAAAATVSAINIWYGRGDVPIGTYQGSHGSASKSKYTANLRDEFPHSAPSDDKATPALEVYRRTLAGAPDGAAVIVSVGFLMNLRDLLESKADTVSPMTGPDLVKKKVSRLVVMGGQFPNPQHYAEYNFSANGTGPDARYVVENWPTPILFSGFSIGQGISTGPALAEAPAANPVRRAYQLFDNAVKNGRSSWDLTAVLAAVRDPHPYWNVMEDGYCAVDEKGINTWTPTPHRGHSYLSAKLDNAEMAHTLDGLISAPPGKPGSK